MSDYTRDSSAAGGKRFGTSSGLTLVECLVILAVLGLLVALLLPNVRSAREPARRNQCMNNLKQIAIALHNYEQATGALPPAYTVDAEGKRLHSWRTLILPFVEQTTLYKTIDRDKPWDNPANAAARQTIVDVYVCPSFPGEQNLTTYLAVTGPHCAFIGEVPRKLADVTDEHKQTLTVVDASSEQAVHWMSPHDVDEQTILAYGPDAKSNHAGVFLASFVDVQVRSIPKDIEKDSLRAMLTVDGGEEIDE